MTSASIIVPSRGGARRLPTLLAALGAQDTDDFEVVVVVDGDVDDSAAVARSWRDRLALRTIVFPENRGRSTALNAGFDVAAGRVLIRCDDDLEPAHDFVTEHCRAHQEPPGKGVIGLYTNVYSQSPYAYAYGRPSDQRFREGAYRTPADQRWRYWAGNVSVTRQTFDLVGNYDTSYRTYGWEDVDWGYRLHSAGFPVEIRRTLETVHHSPSSSARVRTKRAFLSGAARNTFEAIHGIEAFGPRVRPHGPWGAIVRTLARVANEGRLDAAATMVDKALDHVPRVIGEKLVAALVESASLAGQDRPDPNRTIL